MERSEWLSFLEAERARRDARLYFLWALLGLIATSSGVLAAAMLSVEAPMTSLRLVFLVAASVFLLVLSGALSRLFGAVEPGQNPFIFPGGEAKIISDYLKVAKVPWSSWQVRIPDWTAALAVAIALCWFARDVDLFRGLIYGTAILFGLPAIAGLTAHMPTQRKISRSLAVIYSAFDGYLREPQRIGLLQYLHDIGEITQRLAKELGRFPRGNEILPRLPPVHSWKTIEIVSRVFTFFRTIRRGALVSCIGLILYVSWTQGTPPDSTRLAVASAFVLCLFVGGSIAIRLYVDQSRSWLGQIHYSLVSDLIDVQDAQASYMIVEAFREHSFHPRLPIGDIAARLRRGETAGAQ